jgi:septum site-determining protein MinD
MLAIAGGKGGCGKTTTALGLARALAERGDRPVVADADCDMPNLHTVAETDRGPGLDVLAGDSRVERCIHRSGAVRGVDIVPAGTAARSVDSAALDRLERLPETVLLDCPAGATDAVGVALRAATGVLLVSTAQRQSLTDAAKTARMADAVGTDVVGAVVTRVDDDSPPAATAGGPLAEECRVLATVPEIPGEPLHSRVGRASYDRLARTLERRNI